MQNLRAATLILLGHGTVQNAVSCRPVLDHAEALARENVFGSVLPAFWKQSPDITEVLGRVSASEIFIVPMFVSEGYFSREIIPAKLGFGSGPEFRRIRNEGGRRLCYCAPVGTHPIMEGIVLARASEVLRAFPFPRTPAPAESTLLIAGHGTARNADSRLSVEAQARELRGKSGYAAVHPIFMEEEPFIRNWRELVNTKYAVIVPYFISEGLHVAEDIPIMLGEPATLVKERLAQKRPPWRNPTEKKGVLLWYASSVGTHPSICEIIRKRVAEFAAAGPGTA